jgi:hypothetical protein
MPDRAASVCRINRPITERVDMFNTAPGRKDLINSFIPFLSFSAEQITEILTVILQTLAWRFFWSPSAGILPRRNPARLARVAAKHTCQTGNLHA